MKVLYIWVSQKEIGESALYSSKWEFSENLVVLTVDLHYIGNIWLSFRNYRQMMYAFDVCGWTGARFGFCISFSSSDFVVKCYRNRLTKNCDLSVCPTWYKTERENREVLRWEKRQQVFFHLKLQCDVWLHAIRETKGTLLCILCCNTFCVWSITLGSADPASPVDKM